MVITLNLCGDTFKKKIKSSKNKKIKKRGREPTLLPVMQNNHFSW